MSDMVRGGYGELESNHWDRAALDEFLNADLQDVQLDDKRLRRIRRLRLLSDPGFPMWDLSYCWGELADGTKVRVQLPRHQFSKGKLFTELIEMGKEAGVYMKRLGVFDGEVISKCL
jgi:hypothetical protein